MSFVSKLVFMFFTDSIFMKFYQIVVQYKTSKVKTYVRKFLNYLQWLKITFNSHKQLLKITRTNRQIKHDKGNKYICKII